MSVHFHVRALTADDEPALWEMLYLAIYVPPGQAPLPPDIVKAPRLAHYVRGWGSTPGDMGIAAVDDAGGMVGAAWLRVFNHQDPGYGYVDDDTPELSIAVRPEYRGKGMGSRMLEALLLAAGQKFQRISLSVSIGNPAERLYRRFGFEEIRRGDQDITMACWLPTGPKPEIDT